MPRANRYLLEGHLAHVTHKCHDGAFLLRCKTDRTKYREKLREHLQKSKTTLLGYSITCNHVHLLFNPRSPDDLAYLMQRVQGEFAEWYNFKNRRTGAFWNDRYHATMIENDKHLIECLRYIDLNMIRAGAVKHPSEWEWCGYNELVGRRKRYLLIDHQWWVSWSGEKSLADFQRSYSEQVESLLSSGQPLARDPSWTEAIAVGNPGFVSRFEGAFNDRKEYAILESAPGTWAIYENLATYKASSME